MKAPRTPKPRPMPKTLEEHLRYKYERGETSAVLRRTDIGRILAALEYERQRADAVRMAGGRLSNAAYNLAQREDIPATDRASLDAGRREWDEAVRRAREERRQEVASRPAVAL